MTTLIVGIIIGYFIIWLPSNLIAYLRWRELVNTERAISYSMMKERVLKELEQISVPKRYRHFTTIERADYCIIGIHTDWSKSK